MKNLEKLNHILLVVTATLGLTFCSLVAVAESGQERSRGGKGPEHLISVLGVSEENQNAFLTIMHDAHQKRMSIHEQYRGSRQDERAAMDSLHKEVVAQLSGVLNEQQLAQFEQMSKKRHHRPRRGQ